MNKYVVIARDDNGITYSEEFRYKESALVIANDLSVRFPDWFGIVQEFGKNEIHVIHTFGKKEFLNE